MTARARFTQSDISRTLKGMKHAGVRGRVEIDPTGKIVIVLTGTPDDKGSNPLDRLFEDEA